MNISDVVKQLQAVLPKYCSYFGDTIAISTMSCSGTTVTAVCSSAHGLKTGDYVLIEGAVVPNALTSLTAENGVATGVCASTHDLTEGESAVVISGAIESKYNGVHSLISVDSATTFTFAVDIDTPDEATGTPVLEEWRAGAFNGRYQITVTGSETFTYSIAHHFASPIGTITATANLRIAGAANIETAHAIYTAQDSDKMWMFALCGEVRPSQVRQIHNDAIAAPVKSQGYFQLVVQTIPVVVFVPATESESGRKQADLMTAVRAAIFKALLGVPFDSGLSNATNYGVAFDGDGILDYNSAVYIHHFDFQMLFDISTDDVCNEDDSVAFRTFVLNETEKPRTITGNLP